MTSVRKDFVLAAIIGAAVGILAQPILSNLSGSLHNLPIMTLRLTAFFGFLILAPVALAIAHLIGRKIPVIYQFAKFAAVGTLNSFIDFGILNLESFLTHIYSGPMFPVLKGVSFIFSTTNSYFWNRTWTFQSSSKANAGEAAKFYGVAVVGFAVNVAVASVIVNFIPHSTVSNQLWENIGALVGIFATLLWNFLGYKYLVFKKAPAGEQPTAPAGPMA